MRHILRKYPEVSFAQSWFKCIPAGRYLTLVDIFMLSMMFKKLKLYFYGYVFRKVIGAYSVGNPVHRFNFDRGGEMAGVGSVCRLVFFDFWNRIYFLWWTI